MVYSVASVSRIVALVLTHEVSSREYLSAIIRKFSYVCTDILLRVLW
jgi:hypothetical protein